jgi:FixJ family two-component response regulator
MQPGEKDHAIVAVIDDDRNIREAIESLLQSVGLTAQSFGSVAEFLGSPLYEELIKASVRLPVIFISGHADVPMSVRAMKAGAVEFLTKPVRHQDLLDAIQLALARNRARREEENSVAIIKESFEELTYREREVMALVVAGYPNKKIASDLAISMTTVKLHRGQMMRKMRAPSLAELVRMAESLRLSGPKA